MDKNVESILRIALFATFPLSGPCILNWQWCLKVFHVLFVAKRKVRKSCCCVAHANEASIWHA